MTIELTIPNMACAACGETIITAVKKIDPTAIVTADAKTKQVKIETQSSTAAIKSAITAVGYQVS